MRISDRCADRIPRPASLRAVQSQESENHMSLAT